VTEIPLRQSPPLKISQDRSIRIEKSSEIPSFQFDHPISILDQDGAMCGDDHFLARFGGVRKIGLLGRTSSREPCCEAVGPADVKRRRMTMPVRP
jgi:hypothetical protein